MARELTAAHVAVYAESNFLSRKDAYWLLTRLYSRCFDPDMELEDVESVDVDYGKEKVLEAEMVVAFRKDDDAIEALLRRIEWGVDV